MAESPSGALAQILQLFPTMPNTWASKQIKRYSYSTYYSCSFGAPAVIPQGRLLSTTYDSRMWDDQQNVFFFFPPEGGELSFHGALHTFEQLFGPSSRSTPGASNAPCYFHIRRCSAAAPGSSLCPAHLVIFGIWRLQTALSHRSPCSQDGAFITRRSILTREQTTQKTVFQTPRKA